MHKSQEKSTTYIVFPTQMTLKKKKKSHTELCSFHQIFLKNDTIPPWCLFISSK